MKKVFLIGALALGMMSFTSSINTLLTNNIGSCFGVWVTEHNNATANGASHATATIIADAAMNACAQSFR